jgi:4-amino-4-deoxy-L-arabinose transferase-like glycosyltransferase
MKASIPLVCILIGLVLVSISIGPFQNPDTAWEYKAANGVIMWGMPFVEVQGSLINQPPLGFYAQGLFLTLFGQTIETGVILVTLFGFASTLMLYLIGSKLFGKQTALFAAVLFGLSMWELVLSRSFLIDTQCLFWSLSCFYTGILGIQKNSNKLIALSGVLFALAFYTKLFAVFILLPLGFYYLFKQKERIKQVPLKLTIFLIPLVLATVVWYIVDFYMMPNYLPKGLGYMFSHSDFNDLNPSGVVPSYWTVPTFLLNYGLGYFFVATVLYSLILSLIFRKRLGKQIINLDIIFMASIILVLSVSSVLGVTFNLKVPYTSTIKYTYQALPLFCLVAASVTSKSSMILGFSDIRVKLKKIYLLFASLGTALLIVSILSSIYTAYQLSISRFVIFRVELTKLLGYSFDNFNALSQNSVLFYTLYLGFSLILFGLVYQLRHVQFSFSHLNHKLSKES